MIYFDNAATTPVLPEVFEAMKPYFMESYGNASSIHSMGRVVRTAVEEARKNIARHLNTSVGEIFFTSCGTEANNMILKGAVRDLGVTRIISTLIEHPCVMRSVDALVRDVNIEHAVLNVDAFGRPDPNHLEELLQASDKKTLVTAMHANNELGAIADIKALSETAKKYNALFHTDTVQTMGKVKYDLQEMKIDFLSASAHKIHGPKGIGFAYIRSDNQIKPLIDGGAQERNMRAGTENVTGIIGLAKALDLAYAEMDSRKEKISSLRNRMIVGLKEKVEDIQFYSDLEGPAVPNILNISLPHSIMGEIVMMTLDMYGICASAGSACSSGKGSSHVIETIAPESTRKALRLSFSHLNTDEEVDFVIEKLQKMATPVAVV